MEIRNTPVHQRARLRARRNVLDSASYHSGISNSINNAYEMTDILRNLEQYGLSRQNGFVPDRPSQRLPAYYDAWENILASLSQQLTDNTLLRSVASLPLLELDRLTGEHDWQRAYVVLAFLVHGVVHGCNQKRVPLALSAPFLQVCEHIGMRPVVSYAGLCLFNWINIDDKQHLSGLRSPGNFTGTLDEDAFYLVPVLVELAGGRMPVFLLEAQVAAQRGDWQTVAGHLDSCSAMFKDMTVALEELSLCKPDVFYHKIRPHIAGLDVDFETRGNGLLRVKEIGGSAVQSAVFPFIDHLLGIKHESPMLMEMRAYMPGRHRRALERVHELPSLDELAAAAPGASKEIQLKLDECRSILRKWRDRHIAIVTRYIMLPAQAAARKSNGEATAVAGTAGSSPVVFLKQIRNDVIIT